MASTTILSEAIAQYKKKHGFGALCPRAVLFDMDGVLYDSMPNHAKSWHISMAKFGIDMSEADAYRYEGMRGVETIKMIAREQLHRQLSDSEAQKMYDVKSGVFATCPTAKVMDNVQKLQRLIKAGGLKIVVVTGSGQRSLLAKLIEDFKGLVEPELVVSSFDVEHGKPNPEPYLKGLEKAGVEPWQAVVVENAPLGVRAGVAAQIFTIAVNTGPLPDSSLAGEGASLVFPDMKALADCWPDFMDCTDKL